MTTNRSVLIISYFFCNIKNLWGIQIYIFFRKKMLYKKIKKHNSREYQIYDN